MYIILRINKYIIMVNNNKWFTLVELMVVVTILSVLLTIAFLSVKNYSADSRNSVRVTDIWIINQSLWIYKVGSWKYPMPTSYTWITYEWWNLWFQWYFWENTNKNIDKISKLPVDPLFWNEYNYSVLSNQIKYQIWSIIEWSILSNNSFITEVYALWSDEVKPYITGDYKSKSVTSKNLWKCYTITAPSLFINNSSSTWSILKSWNYNFVYDNWLNLTSKYNSKLTWNLNSSSFTLKEVYNKCTIDTLDDLNLYISKLSLAYQQVVSDKQFKEVIYNFDSTAFKLWSVDDLSANWIKINNNVILWLKSWSDWNIFKDTFTWSWINLVWTYVPDSYWYWENTGSLLDSSYKILNNRLTKTDTNTWLIYPVPTIPIDSVERWIVFDISNFNWWSIFFYMNYIDANNYVWIEINSTWFTRIKNIWWVFWNLESPVSTSIANWSTIELLFSWWNKFDLFINNDDKGPIIFTPWLASSNIWLILPNWAIVDNFTLTYK